MQLIEFRIQNYRSIDDSGPVKVSKLTALLGRNESGKTNLLRALQSLNPAEGSDTLNKNKDFPRHRRLEEWVDSMLVVTSTWELSDTDRASLAAIWTRGKSVAKVTIERRYGGQKIAKFSDISDIEFDQKEVKSKIQKIVPTVKGLATNLAEETRASLENAVDDFKISLEPNDNHLAWAKKAKEACSTLRQAIAAANCEPTETQDTYIENLEDIASGIIDDVEGKKKAQSWVIGRMPIFMFLDEYPELSGRQNVSEYLERKSQEKSTKADWNFSKMCKVAGIKPEELQELLNEEDHETRNQLANRASAVITKEIRRLWKDRSLKVRFDTDANYINTFISDPNTTYEVEINFDERSRGFQWFFSFYITFAADTDGGKAAGAILLLDEPGLYLHAKSQRDLLRHLEEDFDNQILYTTHSPFMVPMQNLDSIRTVNISEEDGTIVSNDPSGDSRTLFPLQAALGYDLSQSLFVGPNNLVVEGVTDFWVLSSISDYLSDNGKTGLSRDITITPAGGAQKVPYMVALLSSEELNVLVLLDREKDTLMTRKDLVGNKIIRDQNIIFVAEAFGDSVPKEADIEDLLDPDVYANLVQESYADELEGVKISPNDKIPRIARRFAKAFEEVGLEFHKTRPLRLFLTKMRDAPNDILTPEVSDRFSALNAKINDRMKKISKTNV